MQKRLDTDIEVRAALTDRDWIGNSKSIYTPLGASNHSQKIRAENDFYATDYRAIDYLLEGEGTFPKKIWEVACGRSDLSKRLIELGYEVKSTDLYERGFGESGIDFLGQKELWDGYILTNPPYALAQEFVEHALDLILPGNKIFMFLKIQFLEGKKRKRLYDTKQLKTVYVSRSRINCFRNGMRETAQNAVCYCWFVWEKGYCGDPIIKWIN